MPIDRRGARRSAAIAGRLSTRAGAGGRAIRGSSRISSIILKTYDGVGSDSVVIHPIGFLSDHMEVMYDLDEEARLLCERLGLKMVRAGPSAPIRDSSACSAS